MKCLKCGVDTPFSSRKKLCPACGGKLRPGSKERFASFAVMMVLLYFAGRAMGCFDYSPTLVSTATSSPADPLEDANALDAKYGIDATVYCGDHADDYLQSIAKYDFKWNVGFFGSKFDSYLRHVNKPGVLTLVSNKASLQNGFGAYRRVTIECDYDTQNKKVVEYRLYPLDR